MESTLKNEGRLTARVAGDLRSRILSGAPKEGQYMPSERALCRQLKVSRFTVRRALDSLVSEGLLRRERSRGYIVEEKTETEVPQSGKPGMVFVHAHPEEELLGGYHAAIWAGARKEAAKAGMRVLISSVSGEAPSEESAGAIRQIADGVLCDHHDEEWVRALVAAGLRVVRLDHLSLDANAPELDNVIQDDFAGISAAVHHLWKRGHRRIGYLDFTAGFPLERRGSASRRLGAYVGESRRLGMRVEPGMIAEIGGGETGSPGATVKLLADGASALIVPHKFLLDGALAALASEGVSLGGEFGLVVWGEPTGSEEDDGYPSFVAWSKEQMGREAVARLKLRLQRPEMPAATIRVPARLVDRGTGGRGPDGPMED